MKTVGIIGLGRIGTALAVSLERCGYLVKTVRRDQGAKRAGLINGKDFAVITLEQAAQETEVIFITTPDDAIESTAKRLAEIGIKCQAVLHMSGSLSSEILEPLRQAGAMTGSLHPLQSFPSLERAVENLPGSYFTYEGDPSLLFWVSTLVERFGGILKILPSPETKAVYHAGAVIASNYLVALAQLAIDCLAQAGFTPEEARAALLPLMKGTMNNLLCLPPAKALTGPVCRGDVGVVESHLKALEQELPEALDAYCALAPVLARIAVESGRITGKQYDELIKLLNRPAAKFN
ncbi:MAG: DUF2520 domain-containing protein [Peptococcaceae bacterium]|jgi:predicted short-subunit dehydrogenase-like oxidoreductase (DUF2520 family)|nr:DUF2520 domain-containing protein [Peptococcaceae bacterium]MDH7523697.1 DUF2520 domain-containing protein [Peptococcaceae bacterium]